MAKAGVKLDGWHAGLTMTLLPGADASIGAESDLQGRVARLARITLE